MTGPRRETRPGTMTNLGAPWAVGFYGRPPFDSGPFTSNLWKNNGYDVNGDLVQGPSLPGPVGTPGVYWTANQVSDQFGDSPTLARSSGSDFFTQTTDIIWHFMKAVYNDDGYPGQYMRDLNQYVVPYPGPNMQPAWTWSDVGPNYQVVTPKPVPPSIRGYYRDYRWLDRTYIPLSLGAITQYNGASSGNPNAPAPVPIDASATLTITALTQDWDPKTVTWGNAPTPNSDDAVTTWELPWRITSTGWSQGVNVGGVVAMPVDKPCYGFRAGIRNNHCPSDQWEWTCGLGMGSWLMFPKSGHDYVPRGAYLGNGYLQYGYGYVYPRVRVTDRSGSGKAWWASTDDYMELVSTNANYS